MEISIGEARETARHTPGSTGGVLVRRLGVLATLVLLLGLLAVAPVGAAPADSGTRVKIAVPRYVWTDGDIELVVFTGQAEYMVEVDESCFGLAGDYEVRQMVINDRSASQFGAVTGVISSKPLKAGTLMGTHMFASWDLGPYFQSECEIDGLVYRIYEGVTD